MSKLITADQAAALLKDNMTVATTGFGLAGWAEEVAEALEKRFTESGQPQNLTLVHSSATGDWHDRGTVRIGYEGLIKRWIGAHIGSSATMSKLVSENKIEGYCLPQGVIVQLYREIAAKRPGVLTKVGMGTFVDPRLDGGKMNSATKEDIVQLVEFDGEQWLYYKTFPIDVAIVRATTADENGNLTTEKESVMLEMLELAQAVKNNGGIVIAQVEYLAKAGSLHPRDVKVPGILVDHIVVATDQRCCWQTEGLYFNPVFCGDIKVPLDSIPELPLTERKIIARRAAMELVPNAIVNLGVGIPSDIAAVGAEEKVSDMMTFTTEAGGIGGVPASLPHFGQSYNGEAVIGHANQFDFYDGGGLDVAFLGLAQADEAGNVNVSKFKGRAMGPGGFINVSQGAKKVVYCGTFTAKGLKVAIEDGKLSIIQEGKEKKFIKQVEQITFSGKYAAENNKAVVYITERAVFTLEDGQVTLVEIAPGIDLEKDILALMDFKPKVSPNLQQMPSGIFMPHWGQLKQIIVAKTKG
ncbi:acyl CoA:acetate/3-ketoacid CoA transferase [Sporomusa acidovorans]|uniref:Caffeate CoA-transferase n=1 Tax=Sporomusa acidovorans (strain ATCC 49682 / DSM 3132 / Mol) TaxID=1123286 RepID=A0ABZ3JBF9_SPOA4|nr:acyl CoA:acetate/3-ketoacid CoA transferase [Sporomusa acidovorans]OZC21703.1 acetate CoA-transferase YdiF [Sporomusa acidovorans DSM 3132]SDD59687.1 propionate CoA-transferase [Sporomusa acidovorans]